MPKKVVQLITSLVAKMSQIFEVTPTLTQNPTVILPSAFS